MPSIERILGVVGAKRARQVRIGKLWYEPSQIEHILQRFCKQIFVHTGNEQYPYQFFGSGTTVRFGTRHFLFCTGHQISQFDPERIAIYVESTNSTVTGSLLLAPTITDENSDTDWIDVRALEFKVENYRIPNLASEFFSAQDDLWPSRDRGHFLVFGYPSERQDVDYLTPHITAHVVEVSAGYEGASRSPFVHRLRMRS